MVCRSYCEQKTVVDIGEKAHVWGVVKEKVAEIRTKIIGLIDVITSNHWRYASLAQNGFVINNSSSLSPY